jgi:translation initiation factor 2B subunit (eIF-2B alpha/beta/delta family)
MFKEANAAAHYIAATKQTSESPLVRELAADIRTKRDKEVSGNPTDVSGEVIERVSEAVAIVSGKAPEDLAAFKAFIVGVAKATAQAAKGTGPAEAGAISKLEAALN